MARRRRLSASSLPEAAAGAIPSPLPPELRWPFGRLDVALTHDELRESAYEIFFCACRSTPAGGARPSARAAGGSRGAAAATPTRAPPPESASASASASSPTAGGAGAKNMAVTSRLKRALGLRARNTRPSVGAGGRPLTSAEIMRRQMGVGEHADGRVRKTLVRSLVGPQMSRKVDSLVLPLELLRHLKPADFSDAGEHRAWQLRQLRVLEAGLVAHPSVPLDRGSNASASALREIARSFELQLQTTTATRPGGGGGGLDVRGALSAAVTALSWRSAGDAACCRWADGYPLNVHLYVTLLRAVFDGRDETVVLDEVDELLELIKKTWTILGLDDGVHNLCFTWLFLEKYVVTGETEPDLLAAALAMLEQVRGDVVVRRRQQAAGAGAPLEAAHLRLLSATLASVRSWAEHKLLDYHEAFGDHRGAASVAAMENVVSLAVLAATMLTQDVPSSFAAAVAVAAGGDLSSPRSSSSLPSSSISAGEQVERYIKSSVRRAFTRLHETGTAGKMDSMIVEVDEDPCEVLMYVASETKDLARVEKEVYSRVLRRWHPCPTAVAAAALHGSFGALLKRHVSTMAACGGGGGGCLSSESVRVLHAASRLDKWLLQMAGDDDADPPPAMASYNVDAIVFGLVKGWMDERLKVGDECVRRAHESETWNPRSKAEPYAQSAVDLMKLAKVTMDELLEIQVAPACKEELLLRLVDGVDRLVHQYALLLASSCGSTKESYVPPLPPLTRCNQDSKLVQLLRMAAPPCQAMGDMESALVDCGGMADVVAVAKKPRLEASRSRRGGVVDDDDRDRDHAAAVRRPATSRGTQRLYVRLNTLHYVLSVLHGIDRALSAALAPHRQRRHHRRARSSSAFDHARPALDAAVHHVSELAAYRLVFLDCAQFLHQALYQGGVAAARARPALRAMKQSLAFLSGVLTEQAQPPAVVEAMRATVEAFLTVVLAGGPGRAFARADHAAVAEDFASFKRLFCGFAVAEEVVERETARAEGVLALMAVPTEKLIHEFLGHYAAASSSAPTAAAAAAADELPQPLLPTISPATPTARRWSRSDADTVLRVLCYRDDEAANRFLKKAFDLPKRR